MGFLHRMEVSIDIPKMSYILDTAVDKKLWLSENPKNVFITGKLLPEMNEMELLANVCLNSCDLLSKKDFKVFFFIEMFMKNSNSGERFYDSEHERIKSALRNAKNKCFERIKILYLI
ncbi:hypothetical protein CEXT_450581 [Caerostris extrusa]|uniref:Uncharacterized protein n=1 Tax=Caerostris extrusa TaxID=172846 RepID=A0AAV4UNC5_CAEEX|nr:hypothetical protein CEXT_450581 [Caerostris extrusa]